MEYFLHWEDVSTPDLFFFCISATTLYGITSAKKEAGSRKSLCIFDKQDESSMCTIFFRTWEVLSLVRVQLCLLRDHPVFFWLRCCCDVGALMRHLQHCSTILHPM